MEKTKHNWEPTDNQGYAMECLTCGKGISFVQNKDWNESLHESCQSTKK